MVDGGERAMCGVVVEFEGGQGAVAGCEAFVEAEEVVVLDVDLKP